MFKNRGNVGPPENVLDMKSAKVKVCRILLGIFNWYITGRVFLAAA